MSQVRNNDYVYFRVQNDDHRDKYVFVQPDERFVLKGVTDDEEYRTAFQVKLVSGDDALIENVKYGKQANKHQKLFLTYKIKGVDVYVIQKSTNVMICEGEISNNEILTLDNNKNNIVELTFRWPRNASKPESDYVDYGATNFTISGIKGTSTKSLALCAYDWAETSPPLYYTHRYMTDDRQIYFVAEKAPEPTSIVRRSLFWYGLAPKSGVFLRHNRYSSKSPVL